MHLIKAQIKAQNSQRLSAHQRDKGESYIISEFRASAIPDRLTIANVQWVEGDVAVRILTEEAIATLGGHSQQYVTRSVQTVLNRYAFAAEGGWVAYGYGGEVAYFKPLNPRKFFDNGKLKTVKYETPKGCEALPLLPHVDDKTAQHIYQRYGVEPKAEESFWDIVSRCSHMPIAITEGYKKALSLIAHGIPAIAIRGITQWHKKGTAQLHEAIATYTTRKTRQKRSIYIIFDQDTKPRTQLNVRTQALKLGTALEEHNHVFVMQWNQALGKGIDDVLVAQEDQAQDWLEEQIVTCSSLSSYRREGNVEKAIATIEQLNILSYPVEQFTTGDYLHPLPELNQSAINVLDASMNAGKTTRIGEDWVTQAIAKNWNVLVLSPLNSLGRQTAKQWNLPHIHDFATDVDSQQALWAMVSAQHGLVCCPNSLHRLPDWFWHRPVLLILDEANQVIEHLNEGHTLGQRWAFIQERFYQATRNAIATGAIVLSEDGIPNRAVRFIQNISGEHRVRVIRHRKEAHSWACTVFSGQVSGFRGQLLQHISKGDRLLFVTASQQEGKRLERVIARQYGETRVIRIDSETNECGTFNTFFETPDAWLQEHQPDVLILSPSAKSGVSIEGGISLENAYFQSVWGYFPTLGTDTHVQLLGRYRPSVPRFIFCPPFIHTSGDEALRYPRSIKRRLRNNAKAIASVYDIEELMQVTNEQSERSLTIESAVIDYISESRAVQGAQKSIVQDALMHRLEAAGHHVIRQKLEHTPQIVELWKEVQLSIWREEAAAIASTRLDERHTLDWAFQTLDALDSTTEIRRIARKALWRDEFPGVMFDNVEECYASLCENYGALRSGVLMQARAENLEATKASDRSAAESALRSQVRALHHVPKTYAKAKILALTGILQLLNGSTYSNADPRAIAIKQNALHWRREIAYWLRLDIKATQTPVEICNKLIRKFGVNAVAIARPGKRGTQIHRIYQVAGIHMPLRQTLLNAARQKLKDIVSTIGKGDHSLPIVDTQSPPPGMPSDLLELWTGSTTQEERDALIQAANVVQMGDRGGKQENNFTWETGA